VLYMYVVRVRVPHRALTDPDRSTACRLAASRSTGVFEDEATHNTSRTQIAEAAASTAG
jgi:hypothetical protein